MRWVPSIGLAVSLLTFVCTAPLAALAQDAQDALTADADHHKLVFENDQVRVVKYVIAPGATSPKHSHPDNLQIMLTDHNGRVTTPDGKSNEVHAKAGTVTWRKAGTHTVVNIGDKPIEGFLVEPKNPGTSSKLTESLDPVSVDGQHTKLEFENDQVRVLRYHYGPHEKSAMHQHPDNVQISLTDANGKVTTSDGKTTESKPKGGEAKWRTATEHSVENVGDQPFEGVLVEIKSTPKSST